MLGVKLNSTATKIEYDWGPILNQHEINKHLKSSLPAYNRQVRQILTCRFLQTDILILLLPNIPNIPTQVLVVVLLTIQTINALIDEILHKCAADKNERQ